jgi:hypothetical protein
MCINAAWEPYILGALKVLARPETWKGANRALAVQKATRLLTMFKDGCPPEFDPPNWELQGTTNSGTGGLIYLPLQYTSDQIVYFGSFDVDLLGVSDVTIHGFVAGEDPTLVVGGKWKSATIDRSAFNGADLFCSVERVFCDDTSIIDSGFTPFTYSLIEVKSFNIITNGAWTFRAVILDDWLCGPA